MYGPCGRFGADSYLFPENRDLPEHFVISPVWPCELWGIQ